MHQICAMHSFSKPQKINNIMVNISYTKLLNFYSIKQHHASCKHVIFLISVANSVDPDQMASNNEKDSFWKTVKP